MIDTDFKSMSRSFRKRIAKWQATFMSYKMRRENLDNLTTAMEMEKEKR